MKMKERRVLYGSEDDEMEDDRDKEDMEDVEEDGYRRSGGRGKARSVPLGLLGMSEDRILCRICGDSAVRHVHYGGHCCFSCKAFFRRAVNWQTKNNRNFQCKFESNCEINIKNRKSCQSCRFQKCINTGMNPSWVLSDDQRRKRFKKYREQTQSLHEGPDFSPNSSSQDSGELDPPPPEKLSKGPGRRRIKSAPMPQPLKTNMNSLSGGKTMSCFSHPPSPMDKKLQKSSSHSDESNANKPRRHFSDGGSSGSAKPGRGPSETGLQRYHSYGGQPMTVASSTARASSLAKTEDDDCSMFGSDCNGTKIKMESLTLSPQQPDSLKSSYSEDDRSMTSSMPVTVKEEPELDQESLESLQYLIGSCDFGGLFDDPSLIPGCGMERCGQYPQPEDVKPNIGGESGCISMPVTIKRRDSDAEMGPMGKCQNGFPYVNTKKELDGEDNQLEAIKEGLKGVVTNASPYLQLTQEETLSLLRMEMSFENSNCSFPVMGEETSYIWRSVLASRNFQLLRTGLNSSLLSEAVELCLRRNLMFLQENSDFTNLVIHDRQQLYIENMRSLCHVRGVMQRQFSGGARNNFSCGMNKPNNVLQISYLNQKTGQMRRWNVLEDFPPGHLRAGNAAAASQYGVAGAWPSMNCQTSTMASPGNGYGGGQQASGDLLEMAERLWDLGLDRGEYLVILLIVLFSSSYKLGIANTAQVDSIQNKYLTLLYRLLQSKNGFTEAQRQLAVIMKFILVLLAD